MCLGLTFILIKAKFPIILPSDPYLLTTWFQLCIGHQKKLKKSTLFPSGCSYHPATPQFLTHRLFWSSNNIQAISNDIRFWFFFFCIHCHTSSLVPNYQFLTPPFLLLDTTILAATSKPHILSLVTFVLALYNMAGLVVILYIIINLVLFHMWSTLEEFD